jgi:hypothetical protein
MAVETRLNDEWEIRIAGWDTDEGKILPGPEAEMISLSLWRAREMSRLFVPDGVGL